MLIELLNSKILDHANDLRAEFIPPFYETDADKKELLKSKLLHTNFPRSYAILNELAGATPGNFIAGDRVSWQDLFLANWLETWEAMVTGPEYLNGFPALKKLKSAVFSISAVKIYIQNRPKYSI